MSNNKMTTCKTCGKEMAKSAKVCPSCGAKNKKPFFTKPWFIVIVALIIIGAIASGGKSKSGNTTAVADKTNSNNSEVKDTTAESTTIAIEYVDYTVDDLMAQLEENALKASNDQKYITLYPNTDFAITGIQCYIKNDDTKSKVAELSKDSLVTLTGKITDVGEVLGYSLNIDNIE